jgi:hypothetical protein
MDGSLWSICFLISEKNRLKRNNRNATSAPMIKSTESMNETEYHQSLKEAMIAVNPFTAKK